MRLEVRVGGVGVDTPPTLLRTLDALQDLGILTTGDGVGGRGVSGDSEVVAGS